MSRPLALVFATGVVLAAGAANGQLTGRWLPATSDSALERVLPERLPSWDARPPDTTEGLVVPPKAGEVARTVSHYVHRTSGVTLSVLLVRGEAGPMVYNPLICYDGIGYSRAGSPRRRPVPGTADILWETDLVKGADDTLLRVRWGWGADGTWQAPDEPRTTFLFARELYKVYVVSTADPAKQPDADPTVPFLAEFVPALRTALTR